MSIDLMIRYNEFTPGESGQTGTNTPRIGRATIPGDGNIDTPQEAQDARAAALSFTREGNFQVRPQLPGQNCRPLNSEDIQDIIAGGRGAACAPVRSSQTPPATAPRREYRLFSNSVDLVLDGSNLPLQADGRISMGQARSATAFSHESLRVYFGRQINNPYSISLVDQRYVNVLPRPPRNFSGLASVTLGGEMETAFFHFTYPVNLGSSSARPFEALDLFSRNNLTINTVEIPSTPSAQGYSFATLEFHPDANPQPVNPMVRISFLNSRSEVILQRTQPLTVSGQNTLYLPVNSPIGDQTVHLHIFDNRPSAAGERAGSTRHEMTRLQFTLPVSIPEPPLAFSNASVYIVEAEAARLGMSPNGRAINVPARRYAAISFTSSRAVEGQITISGQTTTLSFRRGPGRYVIPIEGTEARPQVTLSAPGVAPLSLVPAALTPPVYR